MNGAKFQTDPGLAKGGRPLRGVQMLTAADISASVDLSPPLPSDHSRRMACWPDGVLAIVSMVADSRALRVAYHEGVIIRELHRMQFEAEHDIDGEAQRNARCGARRNGRRPDRLLHTATTPQCPSRCQSDDREQTHLSHLTHHTPPSPRHDRIVGEVAARSLLIKLGNPALAIGDPAWRQEALMAAVLALLASYGREVPPSHQLRGFCRVLQDRLEAAE